MEFKIFKSWEDYNCGQNFTTMQINTIQELEEIYKEYEKEFFVTIDFEYKEIFICNHATDVESETAIDY